jgi:hypothetical protein
VDPYLHGSSRLQWINPAAFSVPQAGAFGNSGRNNLSGPSLAQLDLTLSKKFVLKEALNVEFRGEIYNLFNHANFANPGNIRLAQGGAWVGAATGAGVHIGDGGRELRHAQFDRVEPDRTGNEPADSVVAAAELLTALDA